MRFLFFNRSIGHIGLLCRFHWLPSSALFAIVLAFIPCLRAADKSGVSPNTISLPKGPGSIEGLGDSFQPTLNTGTAKYGIGLKVPPGTAGQHPEIHLSYEGGGGNGPLGYGWQISQAGVQRQCDKGIPTYGEFLGIDRQDRFLNDSKEELVPRGDGYFFCKNEGTFVRYQFLDGHWEATLPDGTQLFFGATVDSRIQDGTNSAKIFNWLLEREVDTRGNTITYSYTNFPGSNDLNQRYLAEIRYGPGRPPWNHFHFVKFNYEERWDWFEDCRPGFPVRTGHRLSSVVVATQGELIAGHLHGDFNGDGVQDSLNRHYDLGYLSQEGSPTHGSLLQRITEIGADGISALPPLTLGYSVCAPPDRLSAANAMIGSRQEPPVVMNSPLVDLVDLNGDGLPDVLETGGLTHLVYMNEGSDGDPLHPQLIWGSPNEVDSASGDAWLYTLSSSSTHLADMDGDGRADLVHRRSDATVLYFSNLGTNAWAERQEMSEGVRPPPAPFGEANVRTGDFDFDKRTDLIRGDGLEYTLWFNLGENRYSDAVTVAQDFAFDFANAAVQIADLNGDRVPDIARLSATGLELTVGLGYGRFGPLSTIPIPDLNLTDDQLRRTKLSDITGDGLADLVLERADDGELWYWINLGNDTFTSRKVITGMPASLGLNTVTRWADMNGNGTTDLVYADPDAEPKLSTFDLGVLLNCGTTPNLLTAISNGIGRVTLIGYAPSTQFLLEDRTKGVTWTNGMPFPVTVISAITNLDSLGHQYVSRFRYHDGYYDPVEKQFRGFSRVEQIEIGDDTAPTEVTRSVFDVGRTFEAMKGRVLELSTETEDGKVFQVESTAWVTPPRLLLTGTNGLEVRYAHPVANTHRILELGQGTERRLESEMQYDDFGNQTRHADYGIVENGDRSAFDDERITVTQYAINTNAWILRTVAVQELRDEKDAVVSRSEHFYDDETFSGDNLGIVTVGNLTLKRDWVSPSNSTAKVLSARTRYDVYGNPTLLLDPLARAPGGLPDAAQGHYRRIDYDVRFHAYPVSETIELGAGKEALVFQAAYDEGFGTVTSSTDFNGNSTRYGYDTFARLTQIWKPDDTPDYPTLEYDYALAVPFQVTNLVNFIESRSLDKAPGTLADHRAHYFIGRDFVDGLGRKLMSKHEATEDPASVRVAVKSAVLFNQRQKASVSFNPYYTTLTGDLDAQLAYESIAAEGWKGLFTEGNSVVSLDLVSAHKSRTTYDATLRSLTVINPDGTYRRTVYEPLLTRSYDENDNDPKSPNFDTPMVHYNDGLGRLIQVDEVTRLNDDGTPSIELNSWATLYQYDLNDQLTQITDSQQNVKIFQYDGLKRKVFMNDPDRGVMTFDYDDASNLTHTRDAKNQEIRYTYDGVNRILSEDYLDEDKPFSHHFLFNPQVPVSATNRPDVAYFYDIPQGNVDVGDGTYATPSNTRGKLAYVWDLSGEEHTSYDLRDRVAYVVKRVTDPNHGQLVSYRTGFTYDTLDRIQTLTYPDNDAVSYQYNDRNLVARITGGPTGTILTHLGYRPTGQQAEILYGNGVLTTYDYDSRLRLKNLNTAPKDKPGSPFIAFVYDFDPVSNIRSIVDNRPGLVAPAGNKRRNTQLFQYDDLYRLTRVQYSFALPGASTSNDGEISYRYDRIGNMMEQVSTIEHSDRGLPVADLGSMESGGNAGRWNRKGRSAADPPGPHALSSIANRRSGFGTRIYPYDSNGNMVNVDGLNATWDYKDRLISVEDATMRAEYDYDFSDRRITKRVTTKRSKAANVEPRVTYPFTTTYVGKHFEVREFDAPNKYVFNGNTRIAKVSGSLSPNQRVQRIRVSSGWNLVSVAVHAANGGAQLSSTGLTEDLYKWNRSTKSFDAVFPTDLIPAGSVLWLRANAAGTLRVSGIYPGPTPNLRAPPEGDFLPSAGLEPLTLTNHLQSFNAWRFFPELQAWQAHVSTAVTLFSELPPKLPPQEAFYAQDFAANDFEASDATHSLRFYHQDHLGSSSVVTDGGGGLVEETQNYPFGAPRNAGNIASPHEPYQFAQKEHDVESGLANFEVRVLGVGLARFLRCDPLGQNISLGWLKSPQRFNPYSYCLNRPVILVDPSGMDAWVRAVGALQALGGAAEAIAGATFATGTAVTGVGLVAGGAVALHGADTFVAGMRQLVTGEHASTFTAAGVTKVTGSETAGALVDAGIGIVGTGGIALAGKLAQAGKVVSVVETTEIAGSRIVSQGGAVRQFTTEADQVFYRVYSGDKTVGSWLTAVKPRSSAWAQEALALPPGNNANFIQEVFVPKGTLLERSRAISVPEWGRFRGGAEQFELLDRIPTTSFGPGVPLK